LAALGHHKLMPPLTAPPTIHEQVAVAAPKHDKLIQILIESEYSSSALHESAVFIATLQSHIAEQQKLVNELDTQRVHDKISHQRLRDSSLRRIAFNVTGKKDDFAERLAREERQYLDSIQELTKAQRGLKILQDQLAEAQETHNGIVAAGAKRKAALQELDELYESIFSGPTYGFPEEDQAELALAEEEHTLEATRTKLEKERKAYAKLEKAGVQLNKVVDYVIEAQMASLRGMDSLGGDVMDKEERAALTSAISHIGFYEGLLQAAKGLVPEVVGIGPVDIPKPYYRGDPYQNNIMREKKFHTLIVGCRQLLGQEVTRLKENKKSSKGRIEKLGSDIDRLQRGLVAAGDNLRKVRRGVFDSIVKGLPPY
jgi:hypothetical protein